MNHHLSVVIITHNEELNIARCLRSIKDIADEILVIDSLSTDNTVQICVDGGAKVIQRAWEGYSATKNYGNNLATHSWILSLDADEELSEELKKSILTHKSSGFQGAYRFNRLTNYCGKWIKHGGWYPDSKIRLFNKMDAVWEGDFVHETLKVAYNTPVHFLLGDLFHYSYYTVEEHIKRSEGYAMKGAEKIKALGNASWVNIILSPLARFVQMYILKRGFLDGYFGFKIAYITSREVYLKYKWAYFKSGK